MGDVVTFPNLVDDDELVENLARFADGTLTEAQVKARHHLSGEEWKTLGANDELVEKVEARKLARIRSGRTKVERAQIEIIDAPPILGALMRGPNNPRHVIDAVKVLDGLASTGAEAAAAATRFEITINMGDDHIEHYSKSVTINADDPDDISGAPPDVIAAIAAKKDGDDGQGYF
jgi:hypothetical protein